MWVPMELSKIIISDLQDSQAIILKEIDGPRSFPIVIGSAEAFAIDRRVKGHPFPRPLTHDLISSILVGLGATITRIEITDLQNQTFFAVIHIATKERTLEVDARPSDAIALGIATNVPIFVANEVVQKASQ